MAQAFSFGRELKGLDDDMKNVLIKHIARRPQRRIDRMCATHTP